MSLGCCFGAEKPNRQTVALNPRCPSLEVKQSSFFGLKLPTNPQEGPVALCREPVEARREQP